MIIHLQEAPTSSLLSEIRKQGHIYVQQEHHLVVTPSAEKVLPSYLAEVCEEHHVMDSDIQLSSRKYKDDNLEVTMDQICLGNGTETILMAGPCAVESEEQIEATAKMCKKQGIRVIRGGAFKPRTSPYSFQGLGKRGLEILQAIAAKHGLKTISEVRDHSHVEDVIEHADIIQIGAKAMYDHGILRACGETKKPILIKRGFGTTLQEFVQAAEFVLSGGNPNLMLCERGIRTFENKTRFTLDLGGVAWLKEHTRLPIVLDPSHAMGYRSGVPDLARACVAMGVDGILIEAHPKPEIAKSDAAQQLHFETLIDLIPSLKKVCESVGRKLT